MTSANISVHYLLATTWGSKIWDTCQFRHHKQVCVFTIEKRLDGWESRISWENHEDFLIMTHTLSWLFIRLSFPSKNKDTLLTWQVNYSFSIKCGNSIEGVGKKEKSWSSPLANYEGRPHADISTQTANFACVYNRLCFSYYTQFSTGSALTLHLHMKWGVDNCSLPLLMIGQKSFQVFSHKHGGELDWGSNLWQSVQPIHSTLSIFF